MNLYFGRVSAVFESGSELYKQFVIKFTIAEDIVDALAYPINHLDEPNEGDPVIIYEVESIFGFSFLYQKLDTKSFTRLKVGDSLIALIDDGEGEENGQIIIRSNTSWEGEDDPGDGPRIIIDKDNSITVATKGGSIELDQDGNLEFKLDKDCTINVKGDAEINVDKNASISAKGKVDLKAGMGCTIDGGTMVKLKQSNVIPTGSGAFCAIKVCPYTGMPHVGDTAM